MNLQTTFCRLNVNFLPDFLHPVLDNVTRDSGDRGRGHWGRQGRRHNAGNKQFPEWSLLIISWSQLLSSSFDWDQCNESDHCVGRMSLEWRRYCGWCEHFWRWWSSSSWKPTLRFIFKILEQQTTWPCVFLNSGFAYCHSNNDDNDGVSSMYWIIASDFTRLTEHLF